MSAPASSADEALVNVNSQHAGCAKVRRQCQCDHPLVAPDVQALPVLEPWLLHDLHMRAEIELASTAQSVKRSRCHKAHHPIQCDIGAALTSLLQGVQLPSSEDLPRNRPQHECHSIGGSCHEMPHALLSAAGAAALVAEALRTLADHHSY